jgi:hypothetical protein
LFSINFGFGKLRPLEGVPVYNKIMLGETLDTCAQLCLAEASFQCASFDYVFGDQSCHMSQFIAANVHGMSTDDDESFRIMHYEIKGK